MQDGIGLIVERKQMVKLNYVEIVHAKLKSRREANMNKQCMVTDCKEEGTHFVFDGVFWIRVCNEHLSEFRNFSQVNSLVFEVRDICLYCGFRICKESVDACDDCIKEAERKGCDVSDLPSIKQDAKRSK